MGFIRNTIEQEPENECCKDPANWEKEHSTYLKQSYWVCRICQRFSEYFEEDQ